VWHTTESLYAVPTTRRERIRHGRLVFRATLQLSSLHHNNLIQQFFRARRQNLAQTSRLLPTNIPRGGSRFFPSGGLGDHHRPKDSGCSPPFTASLPRVLHFSVFDRHKPSFQKIENCAQLIKPSERQKKRTGFKCPPTRTRSLKNRRLYNFLVDSNAIFKLFQN